MRNTKKISNVTKIFYISLMIAGFTTLVLVLGMIFALNMPDAIVRGLGIIDMISLPIICWSGIVSSKYISKGDV